MLDDRAVVQAIEAELPAILLAAGREGAWDPYGKCVCTVQVALPHKVFEALEAAALKQGLAKGTMVRIMIEIGLFGRIEVELKYTAPMRAISE